MLFAALPILMYGKENGDSIATEELVIWTAQISHCCGDGTIHEPRMHNYGAWHLKNQSLYSEWLVGCVYSTIVYCLGLR